MIFLFKMVMQICQKPPALLWGHFVFYYFSHLFSLFFFLKLIYIFIVLLIKRYFINMTDITMRMWFSYLMLANTTFEKYN